MKRALFLACALVLAGWSAGQGADKGKKVDVVVQSWLLPGTLASELKSGTGITDVVIASEADKVNLAEVLKGTGAKPKEGEYYHQKMTVYRGEKYATHDVFLSTALPKGAKLKDFSLKGTFTGKFGDDKPHKYTYFEATVAAP